MPEENQQIPEVDRNLRLMEYLEFNLRITLEAFMGRVAKDKIDQIVVQICQVVMEIGQKLKQNA
jgi:hypothetical protein